VPSAQEFLEYVSGLVSQTLDYYGLGEQPGCDDSSQGSTWAWAGGRDEDDC
jgi:hypothetical protein